MDSHRTLRMYGSKTSDTNYTVTVNGQVVDNGQDELFSFITNTKLHGSYNIAISVLSGSVTLTNCTATYPALINSTEGTATFVQPIESPVAVIENETVRIVPFDISINEGTTFIYEHLMFNGPTRFNITTKDIDLFIGMNLYIGDFLTRTFNKNISDFHAEYDYTYKPNIYNPENLEILKEIVYNTKYKNITENIHEN